MNSLAFYSLNIILLKNILILVDGVVLYSIGKINTKLIRYKSCDLTSLINNGKTLSCVNESMIDQIEWNSGKKYFLNNFIFAKIMKKRRFFKY
jgi:hypothetical protein